MLDAHHVVTCTDLLLHTLLLQPVVLPVFSFFLNFFMYDIALLKSQFSASCIA